MNHSLYNIGEELRKNLELITENDGELTEEVKLALKNVESALMTKTDNIVEWVESQKDLIKLVKEKEDQIKELKKRIESRLEKFDSYVESCLQMMGKSFITGETKKIMASKRRMVVNIFDEGKIPLEFLNVPKVETKPDKKAIEKALKEGIEVPGAMMQESQNPSIKYGWK